MSDGRIQAMTPEDTERAQALAVAVSDHVQDILSGYMTRAHFPGAHDAVLNGALHAVCATADSARQNVGPDALDEPLPKVVADQAAQFFAQLEAERLIGDTKGSA